MLKQFRATVPFFSQMVYHLTEEGHCCPKLFQHKIVCLLVLRWKRGRELVHCLYKKLQTCLPTSRRPAKPYVTVTHQANPGHTFTSNIIGSAEALPILCVSDFCERQRERERRLWRHWYHAEIASDHAYDYLDGKLTQRVDAFWLWACRALELWSACKDKELGAWALDWAALPAGSSDWWTTMGKWKLCVRWSDCRGSPSSISLACFKQEE